MNNWVFVSEQCGQIDRDKSTIQLRDIFAVCSCAGHFEAEMRLVKQIPLVLDFQDYNAFPCAESDLLDCDLASNGSLSHNLYSFIM
jgi:hypothetical protein